MHRDIKPQNILVSGDLLHVKIGDMNISKVTQNNVTSTQIGTPLYLAPEVWSSKRGYNEKCDVYSLGCLAFELCSLKVPFYGFSQKQLLAQIRSNNAPEIPPKYSAELKSLIHSCL